MTPNYLSIIIPEELLEFTNTAVEETDLNINDENTTILFGVKPIKDANGNITGSAYYTSTGELIKKIYYNGSSVEKIEHYRNLQLYSQEKYENGNLTTKTFLNPNGTIASIYKYTYNRNNKVTCILKNVNNENYTVEYGYDELLRVNRRTVKINDKTINSQKYHYDILDRIIEYEDLNQRITVNKINQSNELINYTITDILGNCITINNRFLYAEYLGTDIELNGHKTSLTDPKYTNNIMLKKPIANEDDLDYILSNLPKIHKISSQNTLATKRENRLNTDKIADYIIFNKKNKDLPKPIPAENRKKYKL